MDLSISLGIRPRVVIRSKSCLWLLSLVVVIAACDSSPWAEKPTSTLEQPKQSNAAETALPSADPIEASLQDIRFAQASLNATGFRAGPVDGIWGPRSARAIRNFEIKHGLTSANGFLSELNLFMLEKISAKKRETTALTDQTRQQNSRKPGGIASKLDDKVPFTQSPQLVFVDQPYKVLAKPNPFSEQLMVLGAGAGIWIIDLVDGWYKVEAEDKLHGYIKAD